jgi:hypothetical protein
MKEKTDVDPIKAAFDDALKEAGFHKKSGTWYLEKEEVVLVANLQKSQWGQQYYINLGIWLRRLGEKKFRKENECHLRLRARSLPAIDDDFFNQTFDLENPTLTPEERYERVRSIMREIVIPFLNRCGSVRGIMEEFQKGQLSNAMIRAEAKDLLSKT